MKAERTRISDIRTACRAAMLDDAFTNKLIDDGTDINSARALIIDKMADMNPVTPANHSGITVGADEADKRRTAMQDGLLLRANKAPKDMSETRRAPPANSAA